MSRRTQIFPAQYGSGEHETIEKPATCLVVIERGDYDCALLLRCCDCGENRCGCIYCWSCNACENCLEGRT